MIDSAYAVVDFTFDNGVSRQLSYSLDMERSEWESADFENKVGTVTLAGELKLGAPVNCVATIDLSTLAGVGFFEAAVSDTHFQETEDETLEQDNERRLSLIQKKYDTGLSHEEERELQDLQIKIADQAHQRFPLPFDFLEEIEKELDLE